MKVEIYEQLLLINRAFGEVSQRWPPCAGKGPQAFFHNQPISRLTFLLSRGQDRPVLDDTGLEVHD